MVRLSMTYSTSNMCQDSTIVTNQGGITIMKPLEVVKSFYDALGRGDALAAFAVLDDAVEWTEAATAPYYSGTWIGPEAVRTNLFEPLGHEWAAFAVIPESFAVEGSIVATFGTYTGTYKATGKSMIAPFAHRWEVIAGKITNFQQYTDTAAMIAVLS
jgi:ketosteroid isomerase-like protein